MKTTTIRPDEIRPAMSGLQKLYSFKNGYGASVVRHEFSYGGKEGKWELAVLGKGGKLDYSAPVTGDVIGWLSPRQVQKHLRSIKALPKLK